MKSLLTSLLATLAVGLVAIAPSVLATTPDGDTPAVQSVCDVLQGGTAGLYGLCVAYCEAQDLNDIDFDDLEKTKKAAPSRASWASTGLMPAAASRSPAAKHAMRRATNAVSRSTRRILAAR